MIIVENLSELVHFVLSDFLHSSFEAESQH